MTYHYTTQLRTLPGDIHTPVSTYLKLRDLFPQSALMESSDYHGGENGRSFIGLCPIASISIGHGTVVTRLPDGSRQQNSLESEGGMAAALDHLNPEKPDVPLNKNDAFQKVQKRRVQEKR